LQALLSDQGGGANDKTLSFRGKGSLGSGLKKKSELVKRKSAAISPQRERRQKKQKLPEKKKSLFVE